MSPTLLREKGYRFFFFSREEPRMHVHVMSEKGEAKFWLEPEIELAQNYRFNQRALAEIRGIIHQHYQEFVDAWHQHFGTAST